MDRVSGQTFFDSGITHNSGGFINASSRRWMRRKHDGISRLYRYQNFEIAVEVGLVDGMMPATTPRGLAISTISFESLITPTVRSP